MYLKIRITNLERSNGPQKIRNKPAVAFFKKLKGGYRENGGNERLSV